MCIAREDGFARYQISKKFESFKLKPLNLISKQSSLSKSSICSNGLVAMPKSYVNRKQKISDYCILNMVQ